MDDDPGDPIELPITGVIDLHSFRPTPAISRRA
jgi:hypothetical protein